MIVLQYCVGFCHTSTRTSHRYTSVPSFLNSSPISHPSHPSRLSQSTGLSSLCHTANSHLLSILQIVMYMFSSYSLSSFDPLLRLLCPQVCSLCLHLHCCPANRFIRTIFLDSKHVLIYNICLSLSDLLHSVP